MNLIVKLRERKTKVNHEQFMGPITKKIIIMIRGNKTPSSSCNKITII